MKHSSIIITKDLPYSTQNGPRALSTGANLLIQNWGTCSYTCFNAFEWLAYSLDVGSHIKKTSPVLDQNDDTSSYEENAM